jgi:hypothetical protein
MRTRTKQLIGWHGALVAFALVVAAEGCKSTNSENAPGTDAGTSSSSHKDASAGAAGSGAGSGGNAGHSGSTAGAGASTGGDNDGGGLPDGSIRVDGGIKLPDGQVIDPCQGPSGCYKCAASTDSQYLNHCTNSQCEPFDNKARLLGYDKDGKRPALP